MEVFVFVEALVFKAFGDTSSLSVLTPFGSCLRTPWITSSRVELPNSRKAVRVFMRRTASALAIFSGRNSIGSCWILHGM